MNIVPPCKDCPDRHLGCHDRCEKYQAYKKAKLSYKEELSKSKSEYAYYADKRRKKYK